MHIAINLSYFLFAQVFEFFDFILLCETQHFSFTPSTVEVFIKLDFLDRWLEAPSRRFDWPPLLFNRFLLLLLFTDVWPVVEFPLLGFDSFFIGTEEV
jgi:hypothetical protein